MLTRKTVVQTIQHAVHRELKQVLGASSIEELPPEKRGEVVRVIDELSESSELRVALLIDASASMKPKLQAVEEAIRDLALSLQLAAGRKRDVGVSFSRIGVRRRLQNGSGLDDEYRRRERDSSAAADARHDADRSGDFACH